MAVVQVEADNGAFGDVKGEIEVEGRDDQGDGIPRRLDEDVIAAVGDQWSLLCDARAASSR